MRHRPPSSRLTDAPNISLHSVGSSEPWGVIVPVKGKVYRHLLRLNHGFDAIARSLPALQEYKVFDRGELQRMRNRAEELRSSMNSYLTAVLESAETDRAGALFRRRRKQEQADESPSPNESR